MCRLTHFESFFELKNCLYIFLLAGQKEEKSKVLIKPCYF